MKKLQVLVACEESQAITREFRRLGHAAFSCDLQPCSGGHPEWHFLGDVFSIIHHGGRLQNGDYCFILAPWDLLIAHPPCTYLARVQNRLLNTDRYGEYAIARRAEREQAARFFLRFFGSDTAAIPHIAVENPVGHMSTAYRRPDQVIQPWMWGDNVSKATCLWTRDLPSLTPTITQKPTDLDDTFFRATRYLSTEDRRRARSKTFPGIARAIATQWSEYIINQQPISAAQH